MSLNFTSSYPFPIAAITNDHKCSSLKHHICFLTVGQESRYSVAGPVPLFRLSRTWQDWFPSGGSSGESISRVIQVVGRIRV